MKKQYPKTDIRAEITQSIVDYIEEHDKLPWSSGWIVGGGGMPKRSNGECYQGINILSCWVAQMKHGFTSSTFMTFKQLQVLGGNVKGQKAAAPIVYYKMLDVEDRQTGLPTKIPMLKYYRVFNVDQITGLPDEYYSETKVEPINPDTRNDGIEEFIAGTQAVIHETGARAFYRHSSDDITIPPFDYFESANKFYSTLFHELTHWTGSKGRLDRTKGGVFGDPKYAFEELVAELGSAFLCSEHGVYNDDKKKDSSAYIQNWLQALKNDTKLIFKAAASSNKAVKYINGIVSVPELVEA